MGYGSDDAASGEDCQSLEHVHVYNREIEAGVIKSKRRAPPILSNYRSRVG